LWNVLVLLSYKRIKLSGMKHFLLVGLCCLATQLSAQSISTSQVASAGGVFAQNNVSLDWTLGEPMTERFGEATLLTQGFWQGMMTITPVYEAPDQSIKFSIYPNPFAQRFYVENESQQSLTLQLYDASGLLIRELISDAHTTDIDLAAFPSQMIMAKVSLTKSKEHLKTYRLLKSN